MMEHLAVERFSDLFEWERVELLARSGPALHRPVVGEITTSTYKKHEGTSRKVVTSTASGAVHLPPTPRGDLAARW
jgi:hypothetical protein